MDTCDRREGREPVRGCRDMVKTAEEENELEQNTTMHIMNAITKPFTYASLKFP